jgi:hypothetical protein
MQNVLHLRECEGLHSDLLAEGFVVSLPPMAAPVGKHLLLPGAATRQRVCDGLCVVYVCADVYCRLMVACCCACSCAVRETLKSLLVSTRFTNSRILYQPYAARSVEVPRCTCDCSLWQMMGRGGPAPLVPGCSAAG